MDKIIGIPASKIEAHIGANHHYLEFASRFGIPRIIMPQEEHVKVDLLILPGGLDVNPASYGEIPGFKTSNTDVFKQFFFDRRLQTYVENGTPIFGICLGFQQIAAYFKCKLTQHLQWHSNSSGRHIAGHDVTVLKTHIRGEEIFRPTFSKKKGKEKELDMTISVNSHHHQGLLMSNLRHEEFEAIAVTDCEDNYEELIVEAFIHHELPIAGVQWHPEEWYDDLTPNIINKLLLNR